jgi:hypothetical protein
MRYLTLLLICLCLPLTATNRGRAQIISGNYTQIEFVPTKVPDGVSWSPSVSLTESGLASKELPENVSAEVWVQSQPIAVGMSWRPPTAVGLKVSVESGVKDFDYLRAYFRYSSDRVHWSTWYKLTPSTAQDGSMASVYEGSLSIPKIARKAYQDKMQEWRKTNPVWSSDEHELCIWIARNDPSFFSQEFPLIGYIQVRIEGETNGMQLKALSIDMNWGVGGLQSPIKGAVRSTTSEKWFFDLSKIQ